MFYYFKSHSSKPPLGIQLILTMMTSWLDENHARPTYFRMTMRVDENLARPVCINQT